MAVTARAGRFRPSTATVVRVAALFATLGIGLSITDYADYGRFITVAGVVLLVASLHRYGRSGPDEAIVFELTPPARKKKKKKPPPSAELGAHDKGQTRAPSDD